MTFDADSGELYRKVTPVLARRATAAHFIDTLEGPMAYDEGDYILGPGAGGEFWPVKAAIFESTYVLDATQPTGVDHIDRLSPEHEEAADKLALLKANEAIADLTAQLQATQDAAGATEPGVDAPLGKVTPTSAELGVLASERRRRRELKLMSSASLIRRLMKFDGRTRQTINKLTRAELEDAVVQAEQKVREKRGKVVTP